MVPAMDIHERIERARMHKSLEIVDFAKLVGVSYETARKWEKSDGYQPRPQKYDRICEITGVRKAWLASGEGPMLADPKEAREARATRFADDAEAFSPKVLRMLMELFAEVRRSSKKR